MPVTKKDPGGIPLRQISLIKQVFVCGAYIRDSVFNDRFDMLLCDGEFAGCVAVKPKPMNLRGGWVDWAFIPLSNIASFFPA